MLVIGIVASAVFILSLIIHFELEVNRGMGREIKGRQDQILDALGVKPEKP